MSMGKTARKKKSGRKEVSQTPSTRPIPNWLLLGLALIGMGITLYLTLIAWTGKPVAGCPAGSGCDLVLNSRWSMLFGLPTSFWGFLAYTALAGIAFVKSDSYWKLAWTVSLVGVFYSIYLTSVSLIELKAACPYCLSSLALMTVILATVAWQRPGSLPNFSWGRWLLWTGTGALIVVITLHLHYEGLWDKDLGAEEPGTRALAEHLAKKNIKFYGAYWCPHCQDQKEMFGASAHRLPYIECSLQGSGGPQARICNDAGIKVYPTWIIDGQRFEGVLTPEELATKSGFKRGLP